MEIDWKRAWFFISQLLSIIGFVFIGNLISLFFGTVVGKVFYHYDNDTIGNILLYPRPEAHQSMYLRIFQMFNNLGTFTFPVLVYLAIYKLPVFQELRLKKFFSFFQSVLIFVFAFAALFGLSFLSELNQSIPLPESWQLWAEKMSGAQEKMISSMMFMPSILHLIANIFVVGFIAAFGEELMFRGLLQPFFSNWTRNIHWGIFISAALFSAAHFDLNGFIPRLAIGMAFGYIFYYTGNLWVTILAHFLNNSIEVVVFYFKDTNSWCNYFLEVKYMPVLWGLAGLLVTVGILFIFKRMKKPIEEEAY